jgi:hypothetical protein
MAEVLSGADTSDAFKQLSAGDRQSVREILSDTLEDLPPDWKDLIRPKG